MCILHPDSDSLEDGADFKVVADAEQLKKIQDSATAEEHKTADGGAGTSGEGWERVLELTLAGP